MKAIHTFMAVLLLSVSPCGLGQGTFFYDQQSSTNEGSFFGVWSIQTDMPVQSFTPAMSSIDFVRLSLHDQNAFSGTGATVYVNLRSDGLDGPILGSTEPVFMPNGFAGFTNFLFGSSVTLLPGVTYFFEPIQVSGDPDWRIVVGELNYPGGQAYHNGIPTTLDLWFREGIIVPEPSGFSLIALGWCLWIATRRTRREPLPGIIPTKRNRQHTEHICNVEARRFLAKVGLHQSPFHYGEADVVPTCSLRVRMAQTSRDVKELFTRDFEKEAALWRSINPETEARDKGAPPRGPQGASSELHPRKARPGPKTPPP